MRNLVALLLASYISTEQFVHFTAQAEGETHAQQYKLKRVGGQRRRHDHQALQIRETNSDSDSDDDDTNVEEESESGSDSDDDEQESSSRA